MIRLTLVELTRVRWRRAILALLVAAFVIPLLVWGGTVWDSRPYTEQQREQAREDVRSQDWFADELRRCEKHPRRYGYDSTADCQTVFVDQMAGLYREPLSVREELRGNMPGVVTLLGVLAMLVGATFAGADWTSGSMSNQLLFEPRRIRVWFAKATAVGLVMGVVAAVVQAAYWLGIYLVAGARDIDTPARLLTDVEWMTARSTFLIVMAAVAGFALTMLFRNTVFTLGLLFVVGVAGTFIIAVLPLNGTNERYMVHTNVNAVVQGQTTYWIDPGAECWDNHGNQALREGETEREFMKRCSGEKTLSVWQGLGYLGVPFVIAMLLSLWSFWRRDVP